MHALCTYMKGFAHIAAWYFALFGYFWKNRWQQCMQTVHEKAREQIACNVPTCKRVHLSRLTCMHIAVGKQVLFGIRNAFDAGDECIYGCIRTLLAVDTNTSCSKDELVRPFYTSEVIRFRSEFNPD